MSNEKIGMLQSQLSNAKRDKAVNFKMSQDEHTVMMNMIKEKGWRLSAFIRVAIAMEIERIENEKKIL